MHSDKQHPVYFRIFMIEIKTENLQVTGDSGIGIVIAPVKPGELNKCQIVADCKSRESFCEALLVLMQQLETQFPVELSVVLNMWSKGETSIVPGTTNIQHLKKEKKP